MPDWSAPYDPLGAFCRENHAARKGHAQGSLSGLTFAAKDAFHIEGVRTGFGQPEWLRTHPPATITARAVELLLEAGADMVAKAHCDELCYSLTGENAHYGTPENVNAPGRVPGGSSNGSAAAVAGGLVDFALGSDCGGSVRIPASYCGIFGMRPTWGRVPLEGALPFGPSFDVAGWLTRSPELFERVGRVLLQDQSPPQRPRRLLIAKDAFGIVEDQVVQALMPAIERVKSEIGSAEDVVVSEEGLADWFETFRTIQAAEIWGSLGGWITANRPRLGPGVKERLEWAATVSPEALAQASGRREQIRRRLADLMQPGDILCLPTSPRVAPLKGTPTDKVEVEYRNQAMCLLCISGHTGLPQVSLPMASLDGLPLALSLLGTTGADIDLLAFSRRLF
ncbi:MAG: amidase [Sphingomonadales bacterium]|nr:amidase [Sphingomonadales bacterium]